MEKKKNPKADLEKSRSIFFLIGLIVAMGAVFAAFNISTETSQVGVLDGVSEVFFEEDEVMVTRPEDKKEVIMPKQQQIIEELVIVEDNEDIDNELIPFDNDPDEDTKVDYVQTVVLKKEKEEEPIYNFVAKMPVFPGGEKGLMKYIFDKVVYPSLAREQGIEGKVYVRFCVTKYGTVDRVSIARGADPILDKEALRVVKLLPKWEPGENGGRKVSVWYTVPINFVLDK